MTLIKLIFADQRISFRKKRYFLIIISFFLTVKIFSQDGPVKTYYPDDTLKSIINFSSKARQGEAKFYYPNGKLKEELTYENGKVNGLVKIYNVDGNLKEMFNVEEGKREGPTSLFDSTGQYLKDINYKNGMLVREQNPAEITVSQPVADTTEKEKTISSEKITQLKKKVENESAPPAIHEDKPGNDPAYLLTAEIMPEPVGGMKAIMSKLVYPRQAKEDGIQGEVKVKAFIDEYGEVTHAEVIKGIGHGCDESARIAVYYTKFRPGIIKGKPVKIQMVIPIEFKLDKKL